LVGGLAEKPTQTNYNSVFTTILIEIKIKIYTPLRWKNKKCRIKIRQLEKQGTNFELSENVDRQHTLGGNQLFVQK
jgi:hypothetical protein